MNPARPIQDETRDGLRNVPTALKKHYRIKELAVLWGLSADTITRIFSAEPGVLKLHNFAAGKGKRKYSVLSIPESVALRVHERLGNQPLQAPLTTAHPLRVIRLGDLNAGVSKKPRKILKLHTFKQRSDCERVA